jgi:dTDP-4-dehydrorhamnose reductase
MNVLITGANGQLGTELTNLLPNAIATGSKDLDITNRRHVTDFIKKYKIDFIINCAAYTDVEKAETDVLNAVKVNVYGPKFLAQSCQKMIHISTDYVFDGETNSDEKTHEGKMVGLVLCEEEYYGNDGNIKTRFYVDRECSVEDIKNNKFKVKPLKELPKEEADAPVDNSFMEITTDKTELPF